MADFKHLLKVKTSSLEAPKPLPAGSYLCTIRSAAELGTSRGEKQTPFAAITYHPIQAMDDVDQEQLQEVTAKRSLDKFKFKQQWWLTEDSIYRLGQHLSEHLGIDTSAGDMDEHLAQIQGCNVIVHIGQKMLDDGQVINEITRNGAFARAG